jgi:hypothetical protein
MPTENSKESLLIFCCLHVKYSLIVGHNSTYLSRISGYPIIWLQIISTFTGLIALGKIIYFVIPSISIILYLLFSFCTFTSFCPFSHISFPPSLFVCPLVIPLPFLPPSHLNYMLNVESLITLLVYI